MRTTLDLPEDLLEVAKTIARGRKQTLGQTVADLMRRGLNPPEPARIATSPITGLPVIHLGGPPITEADVDALEDEEDEYLMSFIRPRSANDE